MADGSAIEWTDATWNPVVGCSVVSPGCTHCYAMKLAGGRLRNHPSRAGLTQPSKAGPVWTGKVRLWEPWLTQPFEWKTPRRIFVCAHGDLFHDDVPDDWIDKVFAVMALTPQHTYQVLTKRAKRMREYVVHVTSLPPRFTRWAAIGAEFARAAGKAVEVPPKWPLPNVWLGVSAEDQARADERIPHLLATPAAKRFISAEPLLRAINLFEALRSIGPANEVRIGRIDWVIAGGESGQSARPSHPDWFRMQRDQCAAAGVPFFFKQWGSWGPIDPTRKAECHAIGNDGTHYRMSDLAWPDGARRGEAIRADFDKTHACTTYRVGKKAAGAELDGKTHREFPT